MHICDNKLLLPYVWVVSPLLSDSTNYESHSITFTLNLIASKYITLHTTLKNCSRVHTLANTVTVIVVKVITELPRENKSSFVSKKNRPSLIKPFHTWNLEVLTYTLVPYSYEAIAVITKIEKFQRHTHHRFIL